MSTFERADLTKSQRRAVRRRQMEERKAHAAQRDLPFYAKIHPGQDLTDLINPEIAKKEPVESKQDDSMSGQNVRETDRCKDSNVTEPGDVENVEHRPVREGNGNGSMLEIRMMLVAQEAKYQRQYDEDHQQYKRDRRGKAERLRQEIPTSQVHHFSYTFPNINMGESKSLQNTT